MKGNLTHANIAKYSRQAVSSKKRIMVYENDDIDSITGFNMAFFPSGKASFYLYKKVNGIPERIFIGRYPQLSVQQAKAAAENIDINKEVSIRHTENKINKAKAMGDAHSIVSELIREGYLLPVTKVKCLKCNSQANHYHHPDYSRPMHVIPLCVSCHVLEHKKETK